MAQCSWLYVDDAGQHHRVGLYHGPQTGHVMLYCNSRVVAIDFHVLDSKQYTFFIDDELCEVKLEREGEYFRYYFNLNREADTDRNRELRQRDQTHWLQAALFGVLLLALAIAFVMWMSGRAQQQHERWLVEHLEYASKTSALLTRNYLPGQAIRVGYQVRDKTYHLELTAEEFWFPLPLEIGDELPLRFVWDAPVVSRIMPEEPLKPEQMTRLMERVLWAHQEFNPETDPRQLRCEVLAAQEAQGVVGLSNILYQLRDPAKHERGNREQYQGLRYNSQFQEALKACLNTDENDTFAPK